MSKIRYEMFAEQFYLCHTSTSIRNKQELAKEAPILTNTDIPTFAVKPWGVQCLT